jgi:hypothetical protein
MRLLILGSSTQGGAIVPEKAVLRKTMRHSVGQEAVGSLERGYSGW